MNPREGGRLTFIRSMRTDWEIILKVGTSLMILSYCGRAERGRKETSEHRAGTQTSSHRQRGATHGRLVTEDQVVG